jgi:hypothetical protein
MVLREAVAVGVLIAILLGYVLGAGVYSGEPYKGYGSHSYREPYNSDK